MIKVSDCSKKSLVRRIIELEAKGFECIHPIYEQKDCRQLVSIKNKQQKNDTIKYYVTMKSKN
jgi:hypothetical protein